MHILSLKSLKAAIYIINEKRKGKLEHKNKIKEKYYTGNIIPNTMMSREGKRKAHHAMNNPFFVN